MILYLRNALLVQIGYMLLQQGKTLFTSRLVAFKRLLEMPFYPFDMSGDDILEWREASRMLPDVLEFITNLVITA